MKVYLLHIFWSFFYRNYFVDIFIRYCFHKKSVKIDRNSLSILYLYNIFLKNINKIYFWSISANFIRHTKFSNNFCQETLIDETILAILNQNKFKWIPKFIFPNVLHHEKVIEACLLLFLFLKMIVSKTNISRVKRLFYY